MGLAGIRSNDTTRCSSGLRAANPNRYTVRLETVATHSKQRIDDRSNRYRPGLAFPAFFFGAKFLIAKMQRSAHHSSLASTDTYDFLIANEPNVPRFDQNRPSEARRRPLTKFDAATRRNCAKLFPFNPQERLILA